MRRTSSPTTFEGKASFAVWPETKERVDLELGQMQRMLSEHQSLLNSASSGEPGSSEILALAALLHSFYGGVENILKRIAAEIDNEVPNGSRWHSDLLVQVGRKSSNRPALLSESLVGRLAEYLNFRHVFRHAYSFELDWAKMRSLVVHCEETLKWLDRELHEFFEVAGQ